TQAAVTVREVVAVTSAVAQEGKTLVSLGLAVTIAQDYPERRVLMIEADRERPVLANDFGLEAYPGLFDYLLYAEPVQADCRGTSLPNLDLMPAGGRSQSRARALRSSRMAAILDL